MRRLLTTTATIGLLMGAPVVAQAQVDPTDLHMTASGQSGADPVLLNNATSFGVTDVPSNQGGDAYHLELIFAVPVFTGMTFTTPSVGTLSTTMAGVNAMVAGPEVNVTTSLEGGHLLFGTGSSANDLYSYLVPPCSICDNSLNQSNLEGTTHPPGPITTLFTAAQLATLQGFEVFTIPISFTDANNDLLSNNSLTTAGDTLGLGTYVAALAFESDGTTPLATSFTNTGLVNTTSVPPPPVPEPGSLALLGTALCGFGIAIRRRWQGRRVLHA